jgi:hypothetical protein
MGKIISRKLSVRGLMNWEPVARAMADVAGPAWLLTSTTTFYE